MYIDFEKIGQILGFGKDFFYNLKVKQNLSYIKKNRKEVMKKIKHKQPLNVVFYVYDESKWKSQIVYDYMEKDNRFNPVVVVTKNCAPKGNPNSQTDDNIIQCYNFFKSKGMNVEYGYKITPDESQLSVNKQNEFEKYIPLKKFNPDIIFYSHPWYVYKTQGPVVCSKYALTFYVPYFIPASEQWHEYGLRFHKYVYRHYVPTNIIKEFYSKNMPDNSESLKVVGHPILDCYTKKDVGEESKKYIIYAPHWTVCGNNLRFGTFDWSGELILEFAKNHPEFNWVFRPHPLFYNFVLTSGYMGKTQLDNYFNEWEKIGLYSQGGDYTDLFLQSSVMITDCGSFLTEYLVTEKPMIHLISEQFKGNSFINKIDEVSYTAHNNEELKIQLENLILKHNDYKKETRIQLLKNIHLRDNNCAENIIKDLFSITNIV